MTRQSAGEHTNENIPNLDDCDADPDQGNHHIVALLAGVQLSPEALAEAAVEVRAPEQIRDYLTNLDTDPEDIAFNQGHIGHTLVCLNAAMWALATPHTFEPALLAVVNAGGDTEHQRRRGGSDPGRPLRSRSHPAAVTRQRSRTRPHHTAGRRPLHPVGLTEHGWRAA